MSIAIKGVIEWFERRAEEAPGNGSRAAFLLAVEALREKAEREDPKPLTLEELRQMDGDPVWIIAKHHVIYADVVKIQGKEDGDAFIGFEINHRLQENGYGKTWLAYLHKPQNPCKTCLCWEKCLGDDTGCLWINRNEKRLIDLDKVKPMDFPSCEMDGLDVVRYLNTLPTVDAVEVVHAEWKDGVCSACDFDIRDMIDGESEFRSWVWECVPHCPNCGAKMTKKEVII